MDTVLTFILCQPSVDLVTLDHCGKKFLKKILASSVPDLTVEHVKILVEQAQIFVGQAQIFVGQAKILGGGWE